MKIHNGVIFLNDVFLTFCTHGQGSHGMEHVFSFISFMKLASKEKIASCV